jgi:hypothetical protein
MPHSFIGCGIVALGRAAVRKSGSQFLRVEKTFLPKFPPQINKNGKKLAVHLQ